MIQACGFSRICLYLFLASITAYVESSSWNDRRLQRPYPWGNCTSKNYLCLNNKCIERHLFCNDIDNCGDNSDERYCKNVYYGQNCPTQYPFFYCIYRCIPEIWKCDGIKDCFDGSDEVNCVCGIQINGVSKAKQKAEKWLQTQARSNSTIDKWGVHVPRIALALYFTSAEYFTPNKSTGSEISYEISLRLLRSLMRENLKVARLSSSKLALYVNALLVSCIDPRNFYRMDLVSKLRRQVNGETGDASPFLFLVLCKAGDDMTTKDVEKLFAIIRTPLHSAWTETRAFALMALMCIAERDNGTLVPPSKLNALVTELKGKQLADGSFGNLPSTALVLQALRAVGEDDPKDWKLVDAVKFLLKNQEDQGSFGNLLNTYYTLPVLTDKSLLDLNTKHCSNFSKETPYGILDDLDSGIIGKVQVKYSIGYGDNMSIQYTMKLHVSVNDTVFHVMKMAADKNSNYRFQYVLENSKPIIYEVNGIQNDPEYGLFWFFHAMNETTSEAEPINSSPIDVTVKDKQEYIMWYRRPSEIMQP